MMRRRKLFWGLGLIILIQVAGLVGYFWSGQIGYAVGAILANLLIVMALIWTVRQTVTKPLEDLSTVARSLAEDCATLSTALGELGRGNLDARVTVRSQPVDLSPTSETDQLVEELNTSVASIRTAAQEFNAFTCEPLQRVCYVGADSYLEGRICGEVMGEALGGQGQVLVTLAYLQLAPLELRRKGFESVLREKYPGIQVVGTVETTFDLKRGYACAQTILERYPNLTGIYVTDGAIPPCFARAVTEAAANRQVKIIGHDLVDETMYYLQEGEILATLSQDLFAQGHDSVIHLFNYLTTGWRPRQPRVLTHLQLVTRENLQQHWQPGRGCLESSGAMPKRLAQPLQPAARPLRIAVHNRDCSGVDQHLQMGALAAAAKLRPYNARVELIPGGTLTVEPIIDSVVADGYDALSVLAANKQDMSSLNRAADAGVAIATYNSEPLSLQAWVASLADRTQELMGMHQGLVSPARPSCVIHDEVGHCKPNGQRSGPEPEIIQRAISFMQDNLETDIGVADVARFVALDPSYFCRLFTERTGRNPRDFLMDLRMDRAKYYLAHTEMSVMEVCVALGYSPSYFSRLFKRRMGCTPGQYAQKTRSC